MRPDENATIPNQTIKSRPSTFEKRATPYIPPTPTHNLTQDTVPMSGMNKPLPAPIPRAPRAPQLPQRRTEARSNTARRRWLMAMVASLMGGIVLLFLGVMVIIGGIYGRGILAGVTVGALRVGGQSVAEASRTLSEQWATLTLTDGINTWAINPADMGLTLDAQASAQRAYAVGRENGNAFNAIFGRVTVEPSVAFDIATAEAFLIANASTYSTTPVNAGVTLVNGDVQATPPQYGTALDIQATLAKIAQNPASVVASETFALVATTLAPEVTDASATLENARALLANPLEIRVYDPVTDNSLYWSVPAEQWGTWLTAVSDNTSPIGLSLLMQDAPLRDYLTAQLGVFDASRTIDVEAGIASLQDALRQGNPRDGYVVVIHRPTTHIVQGGETLTSIAWDYGIPYLYIQEVNGGRDTFGIGETITIPPADQFLLYPVVPNKRIVVSIPQQRVRVYENGQLIQDWIASTGISSSPTWKGVYQIISHEPNAYAGNWNLYMPYFMGVYQPIPNAEFTNGFHGFPTRGGGQLLWENSLGTKVTYGCILLSDDHVQWLYDWAEEGVVVVIEG